MEGKNRDRDHTLTRGQGEDERQTIADKLFARAFNVRREKRSYEYMRGVMAALIYRSVGIKPKVNCPYREGTVGFDAFGAGLEEGYQIWRRHIKATTHANQPTHLPQDGAIR